MAVVEEIVIDEGLRLLLSPLSEDERRLLESSIREEGVRDPLILWGGLLVDGHSH